MKLKHLENNKNIRMLEIIVSSLSFIMFLLFSILKIYLISLPFLIFLIAVLIILFFGKIFSTYEKCWFISIMFLSLVISILFPEEDSEHVNATVIMLLYLLDTFFNILCELLISKQNRYNFVVSLLVEITEIVTCIVLSYRFSTMLVTILFWIPIDILSFINWSNHLDKKDEDLTVVRKLKGYQEVLVIIGIVLFTVIVGSIVSGLNIKSELFIDPTIEKVVIYLDALVSAVGISNGVFILFRYKEQWISWYISSFLELVINILLGQYILIVLKIGYLTNTTYGYIKWDRYIKNNEVD